MARTSWRRKPGRSLGLANHGPAVLAKEPLGGFRALWRHPDLCLWLTRRPRLAWRVYFPRRQAPRPTRCRPLAVLAAGWLVATLVLPWWWPGRVQHGGGR